jgi:uncharacterized protein (DUF1499 family)
MNPIAWLIGLVVPACGFPAADGLPTPPLTDMAQIVRPASPNTALADRLFAVVQSVAASQTRTYQAAVYPGRLQAHYVARSAVFNFPDLITVQVTPDTPGTSFLIMYSRSVYGRSDFGVNHTRVETWLGAIQTKVTSSSER